MIKYIKMLKWLIKNKEILEKIVEKQDKINNEKSFSLQGVPDFQLEYINDMLKNEKN